MSLLDAGLALLAGIATGLCYFGGLWLTVKRMATDNAVSPLIYLISFVIRMTLAMTGLALLLQLGTGWLLVAVLGILIARSCLFVAIGPTTKSKPPGATAG
ncbi:MAG: ATP synthase subunit I [Planctomycetota bacterium]